MKRVLGILLLMMVLVTTASAQSRGSYFFENSLLRSKLNPAFAPNTNYASFPGVGSLHVETASNVGLKNFFFPEGNVNYLFLNDAIPADQFFSRLPRRDPYLQEQVESDLFGFGMKIGKDGYATLSLSLVENGGISLSGDLLRFAKSGTGAVQNFFQGGSVELAGYAALAAGYSHDLGSLVEGLRVGMRVKLLLGLMAGRFSVDKIGAQFSPDQVSASIQGTGMLSGVLYSANDGFTMKNPQFGSVGAAVDLGASYWLPLNGPWTLSGIEFSASVTDLGGLRYKHMLSSLSMDHQFSFTGINDFSGDIKSEFEQALEELMAFTQMDSSEGESFFYGLPLNIHVGATAHLWQNKANVGLLYYHTARHSNVMLAGGISPLEWLNLGVNWTFLGPANRLGFYIELIPKKYVGLFLDMEMASLRSNSDHIPIRNFTGSLALGLNVLFGK
jgi:hypothetical protein